MDAARCQYTGDCSQWLPFSGFEVWMFVAIGLALIAVGLVVRELR